MFKYIYMYIYIEKKHANIVRFAFNLLTYWLQAYKHVKGPNSNP